MLRSHKQKKTKQRGRRGGGGSNHQLINRYDMPNGMVTIPRNVHGIANSTRVKLMYQEVFLTTGINGYLTLRGNDIFDPQATTSGISASGNQQPQFVDAWKTMYNKYTVLGSKLTLEIANTGANSYASFWDVNPEDQVVTTANPTQSSVARYARWAVYPAGTSTPSKKFGPMVMTTAKINGVSESKVLMDNKYSSDVSNTPADPWYWQIRFSSADFINIASVWAFVHVEFDVVFTDPVQDDDNDYFLKMKENLDSSAERREKQQALREEHEKVCAQIFHGNGKDEQKEDVVIVKTAHFDESKTGSSSSSSQPTPRFDFTRSVVKK
jgi:hypothetical protein